MITVSRPINSIAINGDEYLLGENGKPHVFNSIKETLRFLHECNYTLEQILELNFENYE